MKFVVIVPLYFTYLLVWAGKLAADGQNDRSSATQSRDSEGFV